MAEQDGLAGRFEAHRAHLRGVAYRMLGSLSEAEDAVQEAWLHVSRAGVGGVENLGGWLTTIVARVCLDMLRARKARREAPLAPGEPEPAAGRLAATDPEQEALLADSVGVALLVVLEALAPAERVAFVLHDLFAVPFEEIAAIVGRSPDAARQLASRARRRVQGTAAPDADLRAQREVVAAFLAALRGGDLEGLVAVLDPELVVRVDAAGNRAGGPSEVRGVREWAKSAITYGRLSVVSRPALVGGSVGLVVAPKGRLVRALRFTFAGEKIAGIEVIADPAALEALEVAVIA
jgi:RNA polymerase sigma-70 factor (ECF subfamily)